MKITQQLIFVGLVLLSAKTYAVHTIDEAINQVSSLKLIAPIYIHKETETTPIGKKCLLVHSKFENDRELSVGDSLVVEDIYSRVQENEYGVTSGYTKYAVTILTTGIDKIKGILCEAGEAKMNRNTIVSSNKNIEVFAYEYFTSYENLQVFLSANFQIEEGHRVARPILGISGRSNYIWATEQEHSSSAQKNFSNNAFRACNKEGFDSYRVLTVEWVNGLTIKRYILKGQIKCTI